MHPLKSPLHLNYIVRLNGSTHVFIFQIDAQASRVQKALYTRSALIEFVESLCSAHGLNPAKNLGLWRSEPRFAVLPIDGGCSILEEYDTQDWEEDWVKNSFNSRGKFALENPERCPLLQGEVGKASSETEMETLRQRLQQEVEQVVGRELLGQSTVRVMTTLDHILEQL
jgi:hypothetical protein